MIKQCFICNGNLGFISDEHFGKQTFTIYCFLNSRKCFEWNFHHDKIHDMVWFNVANIQYLYYPFISGNKLSYYFERKLVKKNITFSSIEDLIEFVEHRKQESLFL